MQLDYIVCPGIIEDKLAKSANPMVTNKSSISKTDSLEIMGEFWDKHDSTDYDDSNAPDLEFDITIAIPIELDLLSALEEQAHLRGVSVETLVNPWLG